MFDIGWGELVVIGIVALVVIGPKELPTVLRTMGQWTSKVRRMAAEFQGQFQEAMREAEFAELKKQVDAIGDATRDITNVTNPIETARREIETAFQHAPAPPDPPAPAPVGEPSPAAAPAEPLALAPAEPPSAPAPDNAAKAAPVDAAGVAPRAPVAPEDALPSPSPAGGRAA